MWESGYLEESEYGDDATDSQNPSQSPGHHPEQSLLREGFVVLDYQEDDDDDDPGDQTQDAQEQSLTGSRAVDLGTTSLHIICRLGQFLFPPTAQKVIVKKKKLKLVFKIFVDSSLLCSQSLDEIFIRSTMFNRFLK